LYWRHRLQPRAAHDAAPPELGGGLGGSEWMRLKTVFGEFGGVLRSEARIFGGGFAGLSNILRDTEAGFGVFAEDVPIMRLLFHFVPLAFEVEFFLFAVLRFEAILGFPRFGSKL
jgi:hypothetical protein